MKTLVLLHVLLSGITFAVLVIAGFQAVLLAIQERWLRFASNGHFIQKLPPLITMEKLLFRTIIVGFVLLSVLLVTSFYAFHDLLWHNRLLLQKTILVLVAWVIFAVLLLGRFAWGWRGRKAIYGTFFGVLLLIVIYFGSQLMLEG